MPATLIMTLRIPETPSPAPREREGPAAQRREGEGGLYRLLAWLSPAFPTGAFSYSHGLEAAAAGGIVQDRDTLEAWINAIITQGGGRIDAAILCDAYSAATTGDLAALGAANRRGLAYRGTAELALESAQQGAAFLATSRAAWPERFLAAWDDNSAGVCYAAAFGAAAARAGIALADALLGYLETFAANLVSAGIRLGLVGQTDGQRILAALEPAIAASATAAIGRGAEDFGSVGFAVDLASMAHETQYTRLFRS
jgi:urease accessory protein